VGGAFSSDKELSVGVVLNHLWLPADLCADRDGPAVSNE
jgi:hypothetical protein